MASAPWRLADFLPRLDAWDEREKPPADLRRLVTAWIMTRLDDPYQGVRREPGLTNLWYGAVPHSGTGAGAVVACAYWIEEATSTVRCDSFVTLAATGASPA